MTFVLVEGRQTIVDRILVVGNVRTSEDTIRRELRIARGQPYGLSRVFKSQRRLTALGLFRSVRIVDVGQANAVARDVVITVEEAPVTTVGTGRGCRAANAFVRSTRTVPSRRTSNSRREASSRPATQPVGKEPRRQPLRAGQRRPRDFPQDPERDGTGLALNEYRVLGAWREPRAFLDSANLDIAAFVEQAVRSSSASGDSRRAWTGRGCSVST